MCINGLEGPGGAKTSVKLSIGKVLKSWALRLVPLVHPCPLDPVALTMYNVRVSASFASSPDGLLQIGHCPRANTIDIDGKMLSSQMRKHQNIIRHLAQGGQKRWSPKFVIRCAITMNE